MLFQVAGNDSDKIVVCVLQCAGLVHHGLCSVLELLDRLLVLIYVFADACKKVGQVLEVVVLCCLDGAHRVSHHVGNARRL